MLALIGLNHKSAPLEIRELFCLNEDEIKVFLKSLKSQKDLIGAVVLSTCNRTEVYFHQSKSCKQSKYKLVIKKLCEFKNVSFNSFEKYFYFFTDNNCVSHLLNVASGLDSMVLGEAQIVSQVKDAYRISIFEEFTGTVLNRLFHKAFEASKKVRTKTGISKGISSISAAAVKLAERTIPDISNCSVLLIGTGETGQLVLKSLINEGVHNIYISNRTLEKAEKLATLNKAKVIDYADFISHLHEFDIIIASTSSKQPIITKNDITLSSKNGKGKQQFFFDLSVPKNIESPVDHIHHVYLYNIDQLKEIVEIHASKKVGEKEKAKQIIQEILNEFLEWHATLNLIPTINSLKQKFDEVVENRLQFMKNKVSHEELKLITDSSIYLKDKYVRLIVNNLRIMSDHGRKPEYIEMINKLLELSEPKK